VPYRHYCFLHNFHQIIWLISIHRSISDPISHNEFITLNICSYASRIMMVVLVCWRRIQIGLKKRNKAEFLRHARQEWVQLELNRDKMKHMNMTWCQNQQKCLGLIYAIELPVYINRKLKILIKEPYLLRLLRVNRTKIHSKNTNTTQNGMIMTKELMFLIKTSIWRMRILFITSLLFHSNLLAPPH
jgi:hypothetical protein